VWTYAFSHLWLVCGGWRRCRVLPWLAALGIRVDPHLCVHTAVCRYLAKAQDVVLSPALAAEVATYLRAQFNSPPTLRQGHSWEKPTIDHLYT
jgi:hypothetical protein